MSEPFIGQIMLFGGNFCPRGWAEAAGQILPINQNTALFSLLGTMYGGDGRTDFGLPDLRGRVPIHEGSGPGLSTYGDRKVDLKRLTIVSLCNRPTFPALSLHQQQSRESQHLS